MLYDHQKHYDHKSLVITFRFELFLCNLLDQFTAYSHVRWLVLSSAAEIMNVRLGDSRGINDSQGSSLRNNNDLALNDTTQKTYIPLESPIKKRRSPADVELP